MQKFVQKPQEITACEIIGTEVDAEKKVVTSIKLSDGSTKETPWSMVAQYSPVPGDFFLVRPDGFEQIKPRADFLDRYEPAKE